MYNKNTTTMPPITGILELLTSDVTNPPMGSAGIGNLNYLEIIYGGAGTSTNGIPQYLFPLDYMILWIAYDLMIDLDSAGVGTATYKTSIMKILSLYILNINQFPSYSTLVMDISYLGTLPLPNNDIVGFTLTQTTPPNVNDLLRLSSIWNYISQTQMNSFNSLFINSLLSTQYFRVNTYIPVENNNVITYIPGTGIGQTVGIGYTMRQTFEMFIGYFIDLNFLVFLSGCHIPPSGLPLEAVYTPDVYANFYVYVPLLQNSIFLQTTLNEIIGEISGVNGSLTAGYNGNYSAYDVYFGTVAPYQNFTNIKLDNKTFYYNSIFNILNQQMVAVTLESYQYCIFFNACNQVYLLSTHNIDGNPLTILDGFLSTMYKIYGAGAPFLDQIMGEVYNDLNIMNIPFGSSNPTAPAGQTYDTMFNSFPIGQPIIRGVLDMFMHIKENIITSIATPSVLTYYNKILNYFQIMTADSSIGLPALDYNVWWPDLFPGTPVPVDHIYSQFISSQPINVTGNLFYDISYPQPSPNPNNLINSNIVQKYQSFESVYGVIQFLLDTIIYDVNQMNPVINPILQPIVNGAFNSISDVINYYEDIVTKYNGYLSTMVGSDNITWTNSILYNRLTPLRNTLNGSNKAEFAWGNYPAINLVEYVSVTIGGQLIDTHSRNWIGLNALINNRTNLDRSNNIMLGQVPELITYSTDTKPKYLLYLPLDFWFCKYFNTSLPLIAMRYTDVDIHVKFRKLEEVAYWRKLDTYFKKKPKLRARIMADYVYLEYDERALFVNSKHEYLINTIQRQGVIKASYKDLQQILTLDPDEQGLEENVYSIPLLFANMCKELVWIFKFEKVTNITESDVQYSILNWDDFTFNSKPKYTKEFQILFNGAYREYWKRASYYNLVQPYSRYYSSFRDNIFMYSFSLYPEALQPSGAVNLDKLTELRMMAHISQEIAALMKSGDYVLTWDIYCKSSNMLRVMSGMTGLAFYG